MEKKFSLITAVIAIIMGAIFFSSPVLAGGDGYSVKQAEDLWQYGVADKQKAITVLEKVIDQKPSNNKARYLLGQYNFELGKFDEAYKAFSPNPVKVDYGKEIADLYFKNAESRRIRTTSSATPTAPPAISLGRAGSCRAATRRRAATARGGSASRSATATS